MDFNGLCGMDFDFFKKKGKMAREEYEKSRNEVKLHFRGLCYELQRTYHKKTGGVLTLDKEFHNFNKKSNDIFVEHKYDDKCYKILIGLNSESINIELLHNCDDLYQYQYLIEIFKNRRDTILQFISSEKHRILYASFPQKNKKPVFLKLTSHEIFSKSYDNFIDFINTNISNDKYDFKVGIGYSFPRNECIKQGKAFANTAYDALIKVMKLEKDLYNI
jgi:hypothetical protein